MRHQFADGVATTAAEADYFDLNLWRRGSRGALSDREPLWGADRGYVGAVCSPMAAVDAAGMAGR